MNLFLAVLKTKFGKAQSLFRTRVQVNPVQRKNTVRKFFEWTKFTWAEFSAQRLASASQLVGQLRRPSRLASVGPQLSLDFHGRVSSETREYRPRTNKKVCTEFGFVRPNAFFERYKSNGNNSSSLIKRKVRFTLLQHYIRW